MQLSQTGRCHAHQLIVHKRKPTRYSLNAVRQYACIGRDGFTVESFFYCDLSPVSTTRVDGPR